MRKLLLALLVIVLIAASCDPDPRVGEAGSLGALAPQDEEAPPLAESDEEDPRIGVTTQELRITVDADEFEVEFEAAALAGDWDLILGSFEEVLSTETVSLTTYLLTMLALTTDVTGWDTLALMAEVNEEIGGSQGLSLYCDTDLSIAYELDSTTRALAEGLRLRFQVVLAESSGDNVVPDFISSAEEIEQDFPNVAECIRSVDDEMWVRALLAMPPPVEVPPVDLDG